MKKTIKNQCWFLFFLLLITISGTSLFAQSPTATYQEQPLSTHELDKKNWNKYAKEIKYRDQYTKKNKAKEKKQDKKNQRNNGDQAEEDLIYEYDSEPSAFETATAPFFKFLLIVGGIVLLVFLIMKLMNAEAFFSPKNRKITNTVAKINLENIEENLHESDLDGFIQQALTEQNYALAVRLYYLAILKELSLSKQIKWKKDKTNHEYLQEMSSKKLMPKFRETTLIFERVWYGTGELTEQIFTEIEPIFKGVLQEITTPIAKSSFTNQP